ESMLPSGEVTFRIFGHLIAESKVPSATDPGSVSGESRAIRLGPFKQRALLAILLCRANSVVSVDELVDALWWEGPPRTAHKNIQVYVSHLRRALSPRGVSDRVVHRPPGYRLVVDPADLDAMHFEDLVRRGRHALRQGD